MRIDSRSRLRRTLLLCGLLVLVPGVARAWRTSLPGVGMARAVAVEADGRVVAAGEIAGTGETRLLLVVDLPEDEEDCDCGLPHLLS